MDETIVENPAEPTSAAVDPKPETDPAPSNNLKTELDRVRNPEKRFTKKERLLFEKGKIDEQLLELGETPSGDEVPEWYKRVESEKAQRTAIELADSIENEYERELIKHHLTNTIRPSGNAQADLANARVIVNSVKNGRIIEESNRGTSARSNGSPAGAPARADERVFTPTADEIALMRAPFNLSQEQILKARQGT